MMNNVIIRSIEISDLEDLFTLQQCPKVRRGTLKMPYLSATETRQRLGRGIGSRLLHEAIEIADQWLNLKRIELSVFVDNAPAVYLYKKFGFEIEGTLKKYAFRAGNFVDAYTMARIV